jgi:hypothetical protein
MDTRQIALIACCAWVGIADAAVNVGIVRLNGNGGTYLYTSKKIERGDNIQFQAPVNHGPACCQSVDASLAVQIQPDPEVVDSSARPLYRYRIRSKNSAGELPFIGIAVVGKRLVVRQSGMWQLNVRDARSTASIDLCTTSEGVQITSRSGKKTLSKLYLYLGYDIENTCDTREAK